MTIWKYAELFSQTPAQHRVSLGEGSTPVVRSRRVGPAAGLEHLYFKLEQCNPTGSYKDRYAAAAISDMVAGDKGRCIATTSGNTGSALAAYCTAAGIACRIAVVETAPPDKLKQMMSYGADIFMVRGFGHEPSVTSAVFDFLRGESAKTGSQLQISAFKFSPAGMAGVQTIAYELAEQAVVGEIDGGVIDHVFVQAGGGGLTLAQTQGFAQLVERGELAKSPAVHCAQPEGNDTIAGPLRDGEDAAHDVTCTATISGLQVANVIDGDEVVHTCRASGGTGHVLSDDFIYEVQKRLALEEGLFSEPAGAVGVAGALQAARNGEIAPDARVVCLITGIGFKDAPAVDRMVAGRECPLLDVEDLNTG